MLSVSGRIINKQIKLAKQMLPDTKRFILAHMNVKLCKGLDYFATSWALQRLPKSSLCGAWEAVLLDTWACREFFCERFSLDNLWRCAGIAVSKRNYINSWCVCTACSCIFEFSAKRDDIKERLMTFQVCPLYISFCAVFSPATFYKAQQISLLYNRGSAILVHEPPGSILCSVGW